LIGGVRVRAPGRAPISSTMVQSSPRIVRSRRAVRSEGAVVGRRAQTLRVAMVRDRSSSPCHAPVAKRKSGRLRICQTGSSNLPGGSTFPGRLTVRRRIVNPRNGVRLTAGEIYRRLGELADPAGSDPAVLADVSVQVARRRPYNANHTKPGCPERQSGLTVNQLRVSATGVRVSHPAPSPRSSVEERAFPRRMSASSILAGEPIDREEPAGTATGFGPVMTWFDSTLPNQTCARSKRGIAPDF
jgi:hypothetical protein